MPAPAALAVLLSRLKDSAVGPDGIQSGVLRAGGPDLVACIHSLLDDAARLCHVPLRWRGGEIVALHKKGPTSDVNNYRGLLIADQFSKVMTATIAAPLQAHYLRQVGP